MTDRFLKRRAKLCRSLRKAKANGILVSNFKNVTYLTGFSGDDSFLVVSPECSLLISDSRYTTQIAEECSGIEVLIRRQNEPMTKAIARATRKLKTTRLAIEGTSMTVALRDAVAKAVPKVELVTTRGLVERLRAIKDADEIARIREAVRIAERGFAVIRAKLVPSMTEKEVGDELEYQMRQFGAECSAFTTIVGVGPRAALPHARVTDQRVGESDFVLIDWGAHASLYKSDLTRVLVTGRISTKLERIYGVVLRAQQRAIRAIRPGVTCKEVDAAARDTIDKAGYGRYFGHGLGHGIGLDVHEAPRFSTTGKEVLKAGMVVTVEPGIYLPGWGGVRLEDDVLVTRTGHEVLSRVPKKFEDVVLS